MNIDRDDPRLTAFVLGELDPTERAVVEAYLIDSAECREAVEEIRLTTRWLSERLQEESRAHSVAEKAAPINNHHAAGMVVAKSDAPRLRWWARPAIRMNLIAAAILLLVGLAVLPFVRVDVQPRRQSDRFAIEEHGERATAPAPKAKAIRARVAEKAAAAAPSAVRLRTSVEAGEGFARDLGVSQSAPKKSGGDTAVDTYGEEAASIAAPAGRLGGGRGEGEIDRGRQLAMNDRTLKPGPAAGGAAMPLAAGRTVAAAASAPVERSKDPAADAPGGDSTAQLDDLGAPSDGKAKQGAPAPPMPAVTATEERFGGDAKPGASPLSSGATGRAAESAPAAQRPPREQASCGASTDVGARCGLPGKCKTVVLPRGCEKAQFGLALPGNDGNAALPKPTDKQR